MTDSTQPILTSQQKLVRSAHTMAGAARGIEEQLEELVKQLREIDLSLCALVNAVDDASGKR